jgi:predicted aspartyl protease
LKRARVKAVLLTSILTVHTTFPATQMGAETVAARVPMNKVADVEIVKVWLNDTGPYDFLLDTGTEVTMVKRELLHKLNISGGEPISIITPLGEEQHQRTVAESIAVVGLRVDHLEIDTFEGIGLGPLKGRIQGILGENFLKNFDLLIDNEQQTLTLDRTSRLADTLAGEHLPLFRLGSYGHVPTADRIVIELKVPFIFQRPLRFLVDSGTNAAMLYPQPGDKGAIQSSRHGDLIALHNSRDCQVKSVALEIGRGTFGGINLVACNGMTRTEMDTDGSLPTCVFHQLFISHQGGYVIANPHQTRKAGRKD